MKSLDTVKYDTEGEKRDEIKKNKININQRKLKVKKT